ncbi:hypothetical protein GH741_16845 [Aquibacillus halophilus]|uniref:O-antigen ligase-related domain-containing protein n=1 Tax=Aquibacillus halophilus TaxID=930132 RepID=A0A6A8DF77_9BACI|nr:O-antigen ligase family protein [Aquibacillus halophilus]MRH44313.1 hypothetical protein [Aquibacillus halophilus]
MIYLFSLIFPLFVFPWVYDLYHTFTKFVFLLLFTSILLIYYFVKKEKIEMKKQPFSTEQYLVIAFGILVVISTVFSLDYSYSIFGRPVRHEGSLTMLCYLTLFLLTYRLINFKEYRIFKVLVYSGIFITVYGVIEHFNFNILSWDYTPDKSTRIQTFFDNPNFYGSYLIIITVVSIFLLLHSTKKWDIFFFFISSSLFFLNIIYTSNRSSLVGLFFSLLFLTFFVVSRRKHLWKRWILLVVSFLLLMTITSTLEGNGYINRMLSLVNDTSNLVSGNQTGQEGANRIFIWTESLPLLKEYFWVGSGPDTFAEVFPGNDDKEKLLHYFGTEDMTVDKAHNEYLQIAVTIGVPALIIYLIFLYRILFIGFKAVKYMNDSQKILHYGLLATIIGYLSQAFFNISMPSVAPLFWILLGLCYGTSMEHIKTSKENNKVIDDENPPIAM